MSNINTEYPIIRGPFTLPSRLAEGVNSITPWITTTVPRTAINRPLFVLIIPLPPATEISEYCLETGAMFPYFREASTDGASSTLFAVEPDPHMRRQAIERAHELGLDIEIESAGAVTLPDADDSFDVVIASLVFCTIPDLDAALSEVARVLKPGGKFRFLEHGRGEGTVGVAHDVLAPAWHTVAGGCHLNRETDEIFRDDERFELVDYTRLEDIPQIVPIVRGTLKRRREDSILSRFV